MAGGKGLRMGSDIPKQFIEIAGLPVLMHSINRFIQFDSNIEVIVPMPVSHIGFWNELCQKYNFDNIHRVVEGGESRFHSVLNGLNTITATNGLVAVHDAVRPLVSGNTISRCFETAAKEGNAIPVIEMVDSARIVEGNTSRIIDRNALKRIQTPQVFSLELLRKAYKQTYSESFTDDASVVEQLGEAIHLVDGNSENIKITEKIDLLLAEQLILRPF